MWAISQNIPGGDGGFLLGIGGGSEIRLRNNYNRDLARSSLKVN